MTTKRQQKYRLSVEALESRILPAIDFSLLASGTLLIEGDDNDNTIKVHEQNGQIHIEGHESSPFDSSTVSRIEIHGHGGNDTIINNTSKPSTILGGAGHDALTGGSGNDVLLGDSALTFTVGQQITLRSVIPDLQEHVLRHRDYQGVLTTNDGGTFDADSTFIVKEGLAGNGSISLEASNFQGYYLRHRDYQIWLDQLEDSTQFRHDASFYIRDGIVCAGVSLEAVNFAGYYLRHKDYQFRIDHINADSTVRADATFLVDYHKSAGGDTLMGRAGNDVLQGGAGNGLLDGGDGDDSLHGRNGTDAIFGGAGADYLAGAGGNDDLYGGVGPDHLHGGSGNDYLFASEGDDRLFAGSGADLLDSGTGNDLNQTGEPSRWVLYVSFDGYSITKERLRDWSDDIGPLDFLGLGHGGWNHDPFHPTKGIDGDQNGIEVKPFLEGSQMWSHREPIIRRIMAQLHEDLAPYGINVERLDGGVVEKQYATTLFVGDSTVTNRRPGTLGVSPDADTGTANHTDIAFAWGGSDWFTKLDSLGNDVVRMAHVILHEAGHTYGLFHVEDAQNGFHDVMVTNVKSKDPEFVDANFTIVDEAKKGQLQNSHAHMVQQFGYTGTNGRTSTYFREAPLIDIDSNRNVNTNKELRFTISARDGDQVPSQRDFSLDSAPDGATIDPQTGEFTWTPGEQHRGRSFAVTVRVSDADVPSLCSVTSFTVTVNEFDDPSDAHTRHGFRSTGNFSFNWGGLNEKWFIASNGDWHFMTPSGEIFAWDGSSDLTSSPRIAKVAASIYDDLSLLFDPDAAASQQTAPDLQSTYGFRSAGDYYLNWGGWEEMWFTDQNGRWHFVTPSGRLYRHVSGSTLATSNMIAQVDANIYADLSLLFSPYNTEPLKTAAELQATFGFSAASSSWTNWGGWQEKWIEDKDGKWYFITNSGRVFRYIPTAAGPRLAGSQLIARVDASVYYDLSLLFSPDNSAPFLSISQLRTTYGFSTSGNSLFDWGGWQEKWIKARTGEWYFITSSGRLFRWTGGADLSSSIQIARIDPDIYHDFGLL